MTATFRLIGRGVNRKSMIHRDDVARACIKVLRAPCQGVKVYNVSDGDYSMSEIVQIVSRELGRELPRWRIPQSAALTASKMAAIVTGGQTKIGAVRETIKKWLATDVYDAEKFKREFGFVPQVKLAEGLKREVTWYRQSVR